MGMLERFSTGEMEEVVSEDSRTILQDKDTLMNAIQAGRLNPRVKSCMLWSFESKPISVTSGCSSSCHSHCEQGFERGCVDEPSPRV